MKDFVLKTLEDTVYAHQVVFYEASELVRDEHISKYPVLVAFEEEVELGIPLLSKENTGGNWGFRMSTLEELAAKNLVFKDKIDPFRKVYKSKTAHFCVLVVHKEVKDFVYIPYTRA